MMCEKCGWDAPSLARDGRCRKCEATERARDPRDVASDPEGLLIVRPGEPLRAAQSTKDTNPKDTVGSTKVPLDIVPPSLMAYASVALHNGAGKYGTANYRAIGIRASIYIGALLRHVHAWQQGEECDEEGIPNLAAAAACLAILIDGVESGFITDDRPPSENFRATLDKLTEVVRANIARNAGRAPRHYTIADTRNRDGRANGS